MKKLSIIVPVYNVEQFIRPCVDSIFRQGLDEEDFEVILVNDGTLDNSFGIIDDLISKHSNITIIEQDNQGLSAARNTGLSCAIGDYILFLDSDDLLIPHSLPSLLSLSANMPDLIVGGFVKMDNERINSSNNTDFYIDKNVEEKSGEELFLKDFNPQQCYVWRTLYRREFLEINQLRFIPGIYFEDVPFTTECYLKADRCIKTSLLFYIYRQRPGSIVSSINTKKILDFNKVIARLWEIKSNFVLSKAQQAKLMDTIFTTFSISVWYISHSKSLIEKRKEIIYDLKQKVPNIEFTNGLKQRIVSLIFKIAPSFYIKLRALL